MIGETRGSLQKAVFKDGGVSEVHHLELSEIGWGTIRQGAAATVSNTSGDSQAKASLLKIA